MANLIPLMERNQMFVDRVYLRSAASSASGPESHLLEPVYLALQVVTECESATENRNRPFGRGIFAPTLGCLQRPGALS